MNVINHIADFSSLGGVQSYLYGLNNKFPKEYKLYNISNKILDIYNNKTNLVDYKKLFSFRFLLSKNKQIFIVHNLILSKKWLFIYYLLKIKGCNIIYHEHGIAWHDPIKNKKKYIKRISKVNKIIVNSKATCKLLEDYYDISKSIKIMRSPIFIYEELLKEKTNEIFDLKNKKQKKLKIGFIGRLSTHKNPIFLIEVALILKEKYKKDIELNFVGSGPLRNELEIICKKNNLNAFFFGRILNRREVISEWEFCIIPSIREPLGLVPGEMALFNTLTFSSKVDGLKEMYPDECSLLLIDMIKNNEVNNPNIQYLPQFHKFDKNFYPDKEQCVKKIIKLNKDKNLYKSLLEKHKTFIKTKFDISRHSHELASFAFNN